MAVNLNPVQQGIAISNTQTSKFPPKCVPWQGTFPGTANFTYFVDLTQILNLAILDIIQTVWVDNSQNAESLTITSLVTNQNLVVPPYAQMYLPILAAPIAPQFNISSSGTGVVKVYFLNVAMPAFVYDPNSAGSPPFQFTSNGYLETSDVALDAIIVNGGLTVNTTYTETDISFTTTGASQVISAANAARQYFYVQCPSTLTGGLWLNKAGGTAGPNLSGCLNIAAGQTYETNFKAPSNAISVFGVSGTLCPAGVG